MDELIETKMQLLEDAANDLCDLVEINKVAKIKKEVYQKFCKILGREYKPPVKKERVVEPKFKYVCEECGTKFSLKFEIEATCLDCGNDFECTPPEEEDEGDML